MKLQSNTLWAHGAAVALALSSVARAQVSFTPSDPVFSGTFPQDVVAADLDGDGELELVATLRSPPRIAVMQKASGLKFESPTFTPLVGARYPVGLVAPDLDGDGLPELAVASRDTDELFLLHNLGNAHYVVFERIAVGDGPSELETNDFDGDGDLDFVVSNGLGDSITVVINEGAGLFTALPEVAIGASPRSLAVGCFGFVRGALRMADVAVADHDSQSISVLRNTGAGTLQIGNTLTVPGYSQPEGVVVADFNRDELDDIAACFTGLGLHKVAIFYRDPSGLWGGDFAPPVLFNVGAVHPTHLVAEDFDRDGRKDLALISPTSRHVNVLRQREDGAFLLAGGWDLPGPGANHLTTADLDNSGYPDIIATIDDSNELQPLYNDFANPRTYGLTSPNSVGLGAELTWMGSPSISAGDFGLAVSGAPPERAGLFLYGATGDLRPFHSGFLCIAPPIVRINVPVVVRDDGCAYLCVDYCGAPFGSGYNALEPGSAWNFQFWYRDTFKGVNTSNLTNGVRAVFMP